MGILPLRVFRSNSRLWESFAIQDLKMLPREDFKFDWIAVLRHAQDKFDSWFGHQQTLTTFENGRKYGGGKRNGERKAAGNFHSHFLVLPLNFLAGFCRPVKLQVGRFCPTFFLTNVRAPLLGG